MKAAVVLAACVAAANAGFAPLANGGTGKCLVTDDYDKTTDTYSVTLGSCKSSDVIKFKHASNRLKTEEGYCLNALNNKSVELAECNKKSTKWTNKKANAQWVVKKSLCLDYDAEEEAMVVSKCQKKPLPIGSSQQFTLLNSAKPSPPATVTVTATAGPAPTPTTPGTYIINCGNWASSWLCPSGYVLNSLMNCQYSSSVSSSVCSSICCNVQTRPQPPRPNGQKCGLWSLKNGGPLNACPAGTEYTAGDNTMCAASGYDCATRCCSGSGPQPGNDQKCGTWVLKHGGPTNACPADTEYTGGENTCAADDSNCASRCCSPVEPEEPQQCDAWQAAVGCPTGFEFTGTGFTCAADGSDCEANCCTEETTQTCETWDSTTGCPTGFDFTGAGAFCSIDGSDCQDACCTQQSTTQSCDAWEAAVGCTADFDFTGAGATCAMDGSNCQATCCTARTSCDTWFGSNGCATGTTFIGTGLTCAPDGSDCQSTCCA